MLWIDIFGTDLVLRVEVYIRMLLTWCCVWRYTVSVTDDCYVWRCMVGRYCPVAVCGDASRLLLTCCCV